MRDLKWHIKRLNRLSLAKELGWIAVVGLFVVICGFVCLKLQSGGSTRLSKKMLSPKASYEDIEINHLKDNDEYFGTFLNRIKEANGVLILGTSESSDLSGLNYWSWLNGDDGISIPFSSFKGAGRFSEMYFPLIAGSPDRWKNLEVLVFVNPTYWRTGLNAYNEIYLNRYLNPDVVRGAKAELESHNLFHPFFTPLYGASNTSSQLKSQLNLWVDENLRKPFYDDLRYRFETKEPDFVNFPKAYNAQINNPSVEFIDSLRNLVNEEFNVSHTFLEKHPSPKVPPVDFSTQYRSKALKGMIHLGKHYGVKMTFVLGPYNQVLAAQTGNQDLVDGYEKQLKEIRAMFKNADQEFIDLTDLSYEWGVFNDVQHHSIYGGYRIYERLKAYYENKR